MMPSCRRPLWPKGGRSELWIRQDAGTTSSTSSRPKS
jgi:hypothetical protein